MYVAAIYMFFSHYVDHIPSHYFAPLGVKAYRLDTIDLSMIEKCGFWRHKNLLISEYY